jgi:hypothetical protein
MAVLSGKGGDTRAGKEMMVIRLLFRPTNGSWDVEEKKMRALEVLFSTKPQNINFVLINHIFKY